MEGERSYEFGPFRLDAKERLLMRKGRAIPMAPKDVQTLLVLVEQSGHIVEKKELLERVWPGTFVEEGNLARHISNLRRVLGDSPNGNRYIATIPKRGYRFVAPVKPGQNDMSPTPTKTPAGKSADSPVASLAVVPFVFFGTGEESECLSLGFADALITALGNLEDLTVLPTAAILTFPRGGDPAEACRTLRVRHVLQGNIQKLGSHWRVSIQLFDSQAGRITFSDKFTFTLENVFEVQDEIGRCVARSLARKFRRATRKVRTRFSANPSACDAFLKGLRNSYSQDPEGLERSIRELTQAVEHDPEFALAHATLSHVYSGKYFGFDSRRTWLEKAEFHCRRALYLDPELPEGHVANAYILWSPAKNFQHLEAISEIQKALALQPNLDHAYNRLGNICAHIGRLNESRRAYEKARSINPQNLSNHNITYAYLWSGDWERAQQEVEVWVREGPQNKMALWLRPQLALLAGDLESARSQLALAVQRFPTEPLVLSLQGLLLSLSGESKPALGYVRRACESPRSFGHSHHTHYQIACIYSVLGEKQKAFDWFERSVDGGFACWPFFRCDPNLKDLQTLPEFRTMVDDLEAKFAHIKLEGL
jgi:DNA-binding winged helix-turn-helix (wHTH) protein/tetratricopeptide (TPR) repeat protein